MGIVEIKLLGILREIERPSIVFDDCTYWTTKYSAWQLYRLNYPVQYRLQIELPSIVHGNYELPSIIY